MQALIDRAQADLVRRRFSAPTDLVAGLRVPYESVPGNPLLARAMYLVKYIEQMGTGTLDMIARCGEAGLREPEFEATGTFVARVRRAAPAGPPVVFTYRSVPA